MKSEKHDKTGCKERQVVESSDKRGSQEVGNEFLCFTGYTSSGLGSKFL